mgnify:CR=1 FL=1
MSEIAPRTIANHDGEFEGHMGNSRLRYLVWGWADVFDPQGELLTDRQVLRRFSGEASREGLRPRSVAGG